MFPALFGSAPPQPLRVGRHLTGQNVLHSADLSTHKRSSLRPETPPDSGLRPISLLRLIPNILEDQKLIWLFPLRLAQGNYWKPTLIFLFVTGALLMVDPYDPAYFRHTNAFQLFNHVVSGSHATTAMWVVMISVLLLGLARRDSYMTNTFLYAFQAIISSEILTQVLKGIDRRVRPQDIHSYLHFGDSWFRDPGTWYAGPGSFPSGHMIAAISIAAVLAIRYRHHRWAPWTAYALAGTIGFSRITLLSHFPSDVFAGAFFGYVIARYVVLRGSEPLTERLETTSETEEVALAWQPSDLRQ